MLKLMRLPARLLRRRLDTHKSSFGRIFILAGSMNYCGAAILASRAAMRSGAGLVTLGLPKSLSSAVNKLKSDEVMILPLAETKGKNLGLSAYRKINEFLKKADVLLIGPGLGISGSAQKLIRRLIKNFDKKIIIDADALNALAGRLHILKTSARKSGPRIILTPHPKEMSRLLGISLRQVQKSRKSVAKRFAEYYNIVIVLKGHRTVVCDCAGRAYINSSGNPGMATAGSGDVLAGIISAFLGQGLDVFEAAKYGVYLHGVAGDLAAKKLTQAGLIAGDIIDYIPAAIKKLSR